MSENSDSTNLPRDDKVVEVGEAELEGHGDSSTLGSIDLKKELINTYSVDPVLTKKMALVNAAIDEIGMTGFQWKLFFLNGFGYAVDSVSLSQHNHLMRITDLTRFV